MPIVRSVLRAGEHLRHSHQELHQLLCEHRLARVAHEIERDRGSILIDGEGRGRRLSYAYHAARPVGPLLHGVRHVPLRAWAAWGASTALSFVRHDAHAPARHLAVNFGRLLVTGLAHPPIALTVVGWGPILGASIDRHTHLFSGILRILRGVTERGPFASKVATWGQLAAGGATLYAVANLLAGAELIFGTPHHCADHPVRAHQESAVLRYLRENGMMGGVRTIATRLDEHRGLGLMHGLCKVTATSLAVSVFCVDAFGAFGQQFPLWLMGGVALVGVLVGLALGTLAKVRGAFFRPTHDLRDLIGQGQRAPENVQAQLRNQRVAAVPPYNHGAAHGAPAARPANRYANILRPAQGAREYGRQIPLANRVGGILDGDVHNPGRDAATRRSVAALLRRYPHVDQTESLRELQRWLSAQPVWMGHELDGFGRYDIFGRARRVLADHAMLRPSNTIIINEGFDVQPMARICATIWHAINDLEAPSAAPEATAQLRLDRRRALAHAAAECKPFNQGMVCAPGQSQRLIIILQGFVPEVQVERYDAPAPVNTFVAQQLGYLQRELGDHVEPGEQVVRRHLDQAYLAGRALYVDEDLHDVVRQLREFADLTYDIDDWQPPA